MKHERKAWTPLAASLAAAGLTLFSSGCGGRQTVEIREVLPPRAQPHAPADTSPSSRFGFQLQGPAAAAAAQIAWKLPTGWTQGPARPMRLATFSCGPSGKVECVVTQLEGSGGGLEPNLNRWCGQMGLQPLEAGALEKMPRISLLGRPSPLLELRGTYRGMGEDLIEGALLLGSAVVAEDRSIFVKMVGPEAAVAAERENFKAFCASMHGHDGHDHDHDHGGEAP